MGYDQRCNSGGILQYNNYRSLDVSTSVSSRISRSTVRVSRKSFLGLKVKNFQHVLKSGIHSLLDCTLIYLKDSTSLHTPPPYQEKNQKMRSGKERRKANTYQRDANVSQCDAIMQPSLRLPYMQEM